MEEVNLPGLIENNRQVWEEWTRLHLEANSDYAQEIQAFESGSGTLSDLDLCEVDNYFSKEPTCIKMQGSYAQISTGAQRPVYFWVHGLGEVITALCDAGLHIEYLHEFPKRYERLPVALRTITGEVIDHILHDWEIPSTFSLRAFRQR